MEAIWYNISQVLGITILHSLWQGLLIYFVLRIVFITAPSLSAEKRYNIAVSAQLFLFVCFGYTLYNEVYVFKWATLKSFNSLPLLPYLSAPVNLQHFSAKPFTYNTIAMYMPYISVLYVVGLVTNLLKFSWEWNKIRLIKQSLIPAEQMQQYINTFSRKLNINKHILLKFSARIDVPCVIGYLKPIVLLPVSIATHLTACEIEAILLHELSHIKRNDYLVNLLLQIITVMLFFNPFVQLINHIINNERENGCDDAVLEKTSNPLIYARALVKLEETRGPKFQLVMSATGKKYYLLNRIERIMKTKKPVGNLRHLVITLLLLSASLSCIAWFNPKTTTINTNSLVTHEVISKQRTPSGFEQSPFVTERDTDKKSGVTDTIKHHHKAKTTLADKNSAEREYNFGADSALTDSVRKFYSSPEWKSQMDAMKKQGEEMRKKFESPEWKNQMLAMRKQGEELKKKFNSPEWKAQMDAMKKQFDSPEWKNQMEAMKKQFDSPEWKNQMDAMKKQLDNPEWKAQMEAMNKQFNSAEWKNQMEALRKQAEQMRKHFNSPEWKKSMKNRKWVLKDSVNGIDNYAPEMREKDDKPAKE